MKRSLTSGLAVVAAMAMAGSTAFGNETASEPLKPRIVRTETIQPAPEPAPVEFDPGRAAKAATAFDKRLFAHDVAKGSKSYACFIRQYDSAHLARHPHQKVSAMKLLVTAEIVPEDDRLNYSFRLGVKFRDQSANYESAGECGHAGIAENPGEKPRLGCGVDCDGGGLTVELADDNMSTMVRLERLRLWLRDKPDDEDSHGLDGGVDDRAFRLARVPLAQCKSLVSDDEELAALRLK